MPHRIEVSMKFYETLRRETAEAQSCLLSAPIIGRTLQANVTVEEYAAFLCQAYHHVKHTVPLLMATGARLPPGFEWLQAAVAEYIQDEIGHEQWVLADIAACGFDSEKARASVPNFATEMMVAYAYDTVQRIDPLGFFGMVHVLEGTSIGIADSAADAIQRALDLPDKAFTYLRSHGRLDQDHVQFFAGLMDRIDDPAAQGTIIHSARNFYRLYGDVFRSIEGAQASRLACAGQRA
jgi:pyrroloquinoline quinone (PQQ) biosynthesis protein C